MTKHAEVIARCAASPQIVFEHLDDQTRLAEHMGRSSMAMGGGCMSYEFDEARGRAVGAHIKMAGQAFGISIFVDEVVTERIAPWRKVWRTTGMPRLYIIAWYEMGFELKPLGNGAELRVWIDYELPPTGVGRLLGILAGNFYARWCVQQMVFDAVRHFASPAAAPTSASDT
jgi:hypothetical protein